MADIKKTIEVEIISNTGQVDKISGQLDDVKKQIAAIAKAAGSTIKFKVDGVEKTNDEIQKITANTKKAEKEAKDLTDEYKNTAKAAGEAADETEKLGKNTKKASDGAKSGGGFFGGLKEGLGDLNKGTALSAGIGAALGGVVAQGAIAAADAIKDAAAAAINFGLELDKNTKKAQSAFGISGEEAQKLVADVTALTQVYGVDYQEALLATNALQQQFGLTGKQATDLINAGLASGLDINGDFLASVNEYSAYFAEAGLSADGLFNVISQQIQQGIFSDKGLDSIKEANIRLRELTPATQKALNDIGISAEAVQKGLADGSKTTFDVIQEVSAALEKVGPSSQVAGQAIADIFGGAGEDASLEFLLTLGEINNEVGNFIANMTEAERATFDLATSQSELNQTFAQLFTGSTEGFANIKKSLLDFAVSAIRGIVDLINYFIELYNESIAVRTIFQTLSLPFKLAYEIISGNLRQLGISFKALGNIIKGVFTLDFDLISKASNEFIKSTQENFKQVGNDLTGVYENAFKEIKDGAKKPIVLKTRVEIERELAQQEIDKQKKDKPKVTGGGVTGGGKASTTTTAKTPEQIADEKFKKEKEKQEAELANKIAKINDDLATKLKGINEDITLSAEERANKTKLAELAAQQDIVKEQAASLGGLKEQANKILGESSKEAGDLTQKISELGVKAEQLKTQIQDVNLKGAAQASKDALAKAEEELQKKLTDIGQEYSDKRLAIQKDASLTEEERQKQLTQLNSDEEDARIKTTKDAYKALKDNAIIIGEERKKVEQQITKVTEDENKKREKDAAIARKKQEDKLKDLFNKIAELAAKYAEIISQIGNVALDFLDVQAQKVEANYAKQAEDQEEKNSRLLDNEELTAEQIAEVERQNAIELKEIEEKKNAELKEIQKKQADIELAINIANIIANTAAAVAKSVTASPLTFGLPWSAVNAAIGAVQIATAIAQRQAIQGLAMGGMVYGPGTSTSDDIPVMLSNGEAVINAAAVRNFAPVLSAINESTGGAPIRPRFAAGGVVTTNPGAVSVTNINELAAITGNSAVRAYILQSDVNSETVRNNRILRDSRTR
jgi:hypothetical protein